MRRQVLWYLIAAAWWINSAFAWKNHHHRSGILAFAVACCFFAFGLVVGRATPRRRSRT